MRNLQFQPTLEKTFPFLKDNMLAVYLAILIVAKNKRHLATLYGLLPNNCRLLREDLIKLEDLWEQFFSMGPDVQKTPGDDLMEVILDMLRKEEHLQKYYYDLLLRKSLLIVPSVYRRAFQWIIPQCYSSKQAYLPVNIVSFKGNKAKIHFAYNTNLYAVLSFQELNEPLTYHLMQLPIWIEERITTYESAIMSKNFSFVIKLNMTVTSNRRALLEESDTHYYQASDSFINSLVKALQKTIPVEILE